MALSRTLLTTPLQRFSNEILVYNLLHDGGVDVAPLVGVYSTEAHPIGLIYEHMTNLNLRQYLKNVPAVGGLKLVQFSSASSPSALMFLDNS